MLIRFQRWLVWLLPALLLALYAVWTGTPWGVSLEQRLGLELLFNLRGERPSPPAVVVVAVTRESAQALELPDKPHQWSRSVHAKAVENLHRLDARLLVFDIFFEQTRDVAGDQAFSEALREAGNVLLFARADRQLIDLGNGTQADRQVLLQPVPSLAAAALETAPLILPKIPARVDRFFLRHPGLSEHATLPARAFQRLHPDTPLPSAISLLYN
ncbi:MAG TPA: CHASE2 domain-containing protein, partial [Dongiaceae bacterium]|nr:CHASE2 domain-containing protein [Dongiaceae bacterium]